MKVTIDEERWRRPRRLASGVSRGFGPLHDDEDVVRVLDENPDESLRESLFKAVQGCPKAAINSGG